MEIREKIEKLIKETLQKLDIEEVDFVVEHPADLKMGDYSSSVALGLFRQLVKDFNPTFLVKYPKIYSLGNNTLTPVILASKIVDEINKNLPKEISKVEVAGAGFINFYLSPEFFAESVKEIYENKKFGHNESLKGEKIMVEHTQLNPFKVFHIGHLMPNVIGSTIARIFEWNGAEVKQANYQGDKGLHVAKAVWAIMKGEKNDPYAFGNNAYEANPEAKQEIEAINKKIYSGSDREINEIYKTGRQESLDTFERIYQRLGTKFDYYFFESETADIGKKIVEDNVGRIFEESDGAIVFHAEKYNPSLHTRVFVSSQGLPTYEAKDLGNAQNKYEHYPYTRSVVVTANEIKDYFQVVIEAMKNVLPELAKMTKHITHGMLRLPSGKMSSRTGDVITAESLIDMVKEKTKGDEQIAIGAIKYMILRQSIGGDIIFDIEKSVSTEGDSGVYLQYAYVRANSLLEKGKIEGLHPNVKIPADWKTTELENFLYRFPEVVLRSAQEFQPHHIVSYLTELARAFNSFYGNNKIIDKDDAASPYKLALTQAFSTVMKNGLTILGIPTPEKM